MNFNKMAFSRGSFLNLMARTRALIDNIVQSQQQGWTIPHGGDRKTNKSALSQHILGVLEALLPNTTKRKKKKRERTTPLSIEGVYKIVRCTSFTQDIIMDFNTMAFSRGSFLNLMARTRALIDNIVQSQQQCLTIPHGGDRRTNESVLSQHILGVLEALLPKVTERKKKKQERTTPLSIEGV